MPNLDGLRRDFADFLDLFQISDVEGLSDELTGKADLSHNHTMTEVLGLDVALGSKADAAHTHDFTELGDTPPDYSGAGGYVVRVKVTEDGLELVPGSAVVSVGSIEVGDPVLKLKRKPAPAAGPGQWFPAWDSAIVDAANWDELQPFLFGVKAEVVDTLVDQFLAVNVSRSANVAAIELANTDECALLCQLLYGDLLFDCYDPVTNSSPAAPADFAAWGMTIELPDPIDFIPAGRYAIASIDVSNRLIYIDLPGADQGLTAVTEFVECYQFRIAGTDTQCKWRAVTDAHVFMGRIPGLRNLDELQDHLHGVQHIVTPAYTVWANPYGLFGPGGTTNTTNNVRQARSGSITRSRALGAFLYIFGGNYIP